MDSTINKDKKKMRMISVEAKETRGDFWGAADLTCFLGCLGELLPGRENRNYSQERGCVLLNSFSI